MRRGITPWNQLPHGIRHIVDPWRTPMPRRSYLRRGPRSAVLRRLAFVSRLEPKVAITVNVAHTVRLQRPATGRFVVVLMRGASSPQADRQLPAALAHARPAPGSTRREAEVPFRSPGLLRVTRYRVADPVLRRPPEPVLRGHRAVEGRTRLPLPAAVEKPDLVMRLVPCSKRRMETTPGSEGGPQPLLRAAVVMPDLVMRLARRAERLTEMMPGSPVRVVKRNEAARVAAALEMSGGVPAARGAAAHEMGRGVPAARRASRGAPETWPVEAPAGDLPINIDQITEQVLRQLDRRLIASRERLGRI